MSIGLKLPSNQISWTRDKTIATENDLPTKWYYHTIQIESDSSTFEQYCIYFSFISEYQNAISNKNILVEQLYRSGFSYTTNSIFCVATGTLFSSKTYRVIGVQGHYGDENFIIIARYDPSNNSNDVFFKDELVMSDTTKIYDTVTRIR